VILVVTTHKKDTNASTLARLLPKMVAPAPAQNTTRKREALGRQCNGTLAKRLESFIVSINGTPVIGICVDIFRTIHRLITFLTGIPAILRLGKTSDVKFSCSVPQNSSTPVSPRITLMIKDKNNVMPSNRGNPSRLVIPWITVGIDV